MAPCSSLQALTAQRQSLSLDTRTLLSHYPSQRLTLTLTLTLTSAAAAVHKRVVQALQAVQREKEEEIRRLQTAVGGASEAEMAAAVSAKEAALKAATKLQAGDGLG